MRGAWLIAIMGEALAAPPPKPLPVPKPEKAKVVAGQQCVIGMPPPGQDCQGNPVYPAHPIYYAPGPPEWTPILYATVPTLPTYGGTFDKGTLLGGIQPAHSVLTYILYQVNLVQLMAGSGSCCHILSDAVTTGGWTIRAKLQQGLCFVLSDMPMSMAELYWALGSPTIDKTTGVITPTTPGPPYYGSSWVGAPSGPGCAWPPPTSTPVQIAAAYTDVIVN
jgi:hypothetical protein